MNANPLQPGVIPAQPLNPAGAAAAALPGGLGGQNAAAGDPANLDLMDDPDMMPAEVLDLGKPMEERNLVDHALEYNPHRKTLEVFLMLVMLTSFIGVITYAILSYALVETFFSAGVASHLYATRYDICNDEACEEFEHRTMGFVNWRSNPCDSYFLFACTGFQKEAVDLNVAIYQSHLDFISSEKDMLADFLQKDFHFSLMEKVQAETMAAQDGKIVQKEPNVVYTNLAKDMGETVVFDIEIDHDGTCYLYPPTMHFPHAAFRNPEFKSDFIKAFEDYYDTAFQPKDDMFRFDVEEFFNLQKSLAELMGDPKRRVYRPMEVPSMQEGLSKLIGSTLTGDFGCKGKIICIDFQYCDGLETLMNETSKVTLNNMIRFRVILRHMLYGQQTTSLAKVYYQYTHFLNQPPHVEIRCLDALEYILRPYYVDFLRRIHVFQYGDIHPMVQTQAEKALKKLVEYISIQLGRSILNEDDVIQAKKLLQEVQFKLVYPWKLGDRAPHPLVDGLIGLTVTTGQNAFESFRKVLSQGFFDTFKYRASWPLQTFAHEPEYVHHQNTLYVPYSVFAWAYMDKNSKLPFSLPVYGFKIVRELFKVFDYRSQWWVAQPTGTLPKYLKVQQCVEKLETQYGVENSVETYETVAELSTANLLHDAFVEQVSFNKEKFEDIRLPFLQSVHSTTQFYVALASELCARTNVTTASTMNSDYGVKTSEQRLALIARHMPQFTKHFGCNHKHRMYLVRNYQECLFWKRK